MERSPLILIADDQAGILRMLTMVLENEGYAVVVAQDGEEALNLAKTQNPDLAILDVMMPGMTGIDVCREMRKYPPTARTPVMMLSAKGQVPDKVMGFEAGADDYVPKPVAREELLARVKALLVRSQYTQPAVSQARVVTFVGAKGGVGTTTAVLNVGAHLVSTGKRVVVVELQPGPGTAVYQLKLEPSQDLSNLLSLEAGAINWQAISRTLAQHASGLRLISAPQTAVTDTVPPHHAEAVLEALATHADFILVDLQSVAGETNRSILEQTDDIFLITEPEPISLQITRKIMAWLQNWGLFERVHIVVNARSQSANLLTRDALEQELFGTNGQKGHIETYIPPAPEMFQLASRQGQPLVLLKPELVSAQAILKLAGFLLKSEPLLV